MQKNAIGIQKNFLCSKKAKKAIKYKFWVIIVIRTSSYLS